MSAKQRRIFPVSFFKLWAKVCILPLFLLHLRTSLGPGFSQGLLSSPCLKAVMVTYPNIVTASTPQLSSFLVVFLKISIAGRKQMVDAACVAHNDNLLPFFLNYSIKFRGKISNPVKFMVQWQFIWKNLTFVPKSYKSLTTICFLTCHSPLRWYSFFGIINYHYCCCCYYSRRCVWEERWNLD